MKKIIKILCITIIAGIFVLMPFPAQAQQLHPFFVSPEYAADQIKKSSKMLLVDIRPKAAFEKIHINGAVHIPLHFVKTKDYLKQKTLVFVNNGFRKQQLIEACAAMNKKGFKTRILSGGLNAWIQKGLPVKGDPFAGKTISRVSPRDAFNEHITRSFLPADISEGQPEPVFDGTVHLNLSGKNKSDTLALYNKENPNNCILVFNQTGRGYEDLGDQLSSSGTGNIFFLTGGVAAYKRFLENRKRAKVPRSRRMMTVSKMPCKNCSD